VAELNAKVQALEAQFNAAVDDKNAAIRESERCQLKLQLANRLINALASEGALGRRAGRKQYGMQLRHVQACPTAPFLQLQNPTSTTPLLLAAPWILSKCPGERWARTVEQLRAGYDVLTGDMLVARWVGRVLLP
jgi:dynein heavy chain